MAYQPKSYRKFLAASVSAVVAASAIAPVAASAASNNFKDVQAGTELADAVNYLVSTGTTNGESATEFGVHHDITRAQAAKMIAGVMGLDTKNVKDPGFPDVSKDNYYYSYIAAAANAGVFQGDGAGKFNPDKPITRAEAAKVFVKAFGLELKADAKTPFTDVPDASDANLGWATPYINTLYAAGLVKGTNDAGTTFEPNANLERGAFALLAYRVHNYLEELKAAPAVTSVSAINAKQIQVTFNKAVDSTTAKDLTNYYVRKSDDADAKDLKTLDSTAKVSLSADGKTVTITATTDLITNLGVEDNTVFQFTVDGVKTAEGVDVPSYTQVLSVHDVTAPTFVSATASAKTSTNTITLEFSEPVVYTSGVVKVDGVAASVAPGDTPTTLKVTTGKNLNAGSTYSLDILNFQDFAGNFLTPNPVKTSVTVTSDAVAPSVTNVQVLRDNLVRVTFSKSINASTLNESTVKLLDGNYTDLAASNIIGIVKAPTDTNNTVFDIKLKDTPALPFNNGVFNATLVFTDSIKDTLGNAMVTTNRAITLTRDTVGPQVSSVKFVKADSTGAKYGGVDLTHGAIVVKFNESVSLGDLTGTTIIDNNGKDVTDNYLTDFTGAQVSSDDDTEVVIPLTATIETDDDVSSLTLRLPAGAANDLALDTNASSSYVSTFNVEAGTNTAGDTTKPTIAFKSVTPKTATDGNVIKVDITEDNLDTSTVLNLNNYRLDGAPLPSGTWITIDTSGSVHTVNIHLPHGSVDETGNHILNINGIKDQAGNVAAPFAKNDVVLTDDVAPELSTATLNTNGSVSLGFSEDLAVGPDTKDLVVKLNGVTLENGTTSGTTAPFTLTPITSGAEAGKYALTVQVKYDAGDGTDGNGDETLYIDADGNGLLTPGDIKVSTGTFNPSDAGDYDLNKASKLVIGTVASPATAADAAGNTLAGNASITCS